jgi:hypothetical protein
VTFAELPPGIALATGDVIAFAADVEKDEHRVVADKPAKKLAQRELVLAARHLDSVKRGADRLW